MSRPRSATSHRRRSFLAPLLVAGLSLLSCGRDSTGPGDAQRFAAFALDPRMPEALAVEGAGDVIPFNRVRVTLSRLEGTVIKEEIVPFGPETESVSLDLEVPLPFGTTSEGIQLLLDMQYINAQGDTVFRAGPQTVTARPSSAGEPTPVIPVDVEYVGPGAEAQSVVISQQAGVVVSGTTMTFSAAALDGQGQPIANAPVIFSSPDPTLVTITPQGVATWLPVRGSARIVAKLPTDADADTVTMTVALPATELVLVSGGGQTGGAGLPLELPIQLRVQAVDDVPVEGVTVTFTVTAGGGELSALTAVSDVDGLVSTQWTLGEAVGAQAITATYPGLIGGPVTVTANSGAGAADALLTISGNGQQGTPGQPLALPLIVRVVDAFGNGVAGETVEFNVLSGGGSTAPTQATTDATGHASTQWTLGATLGSQSVEAYAPAIDDAASFLATAASSGVAHWTGAVSGDWSVAGNWDIGAVPATTDSVVIPNVDPNPYPRLTAATIVGAVNVTAGTLWLNGQSLIVARNFATTGSGVLVMQEAESQLHVAGNARFAGGNTSGLLTAGGISIAGSFVQDGTNSTASFQASGEHVTVLQSATPTVSFTDPGLTVATSRFQDLAWIGGGVLTQQSGISVGGDYIISTGEPTIHLGIGGTAGRYLEFRNFFSLGATTFDNVRVIVTQANDVAPADVSITNISFQNLPASATQFIATHPGGGSTITLDNVAFQVAPATGAFISANDNDTADGQPLVVNVANATPATPGGGVTTFNGAIVNWPASASRTWVGTTSTDWHEPSNWFPASVPGALDEVLIGATPNQPLVSAAAQAGNLYVGFGATLTLDPAAGAILTVNGDIEVDGAVVADPTVTGFRAAGTARTIRGLNVEHVDVRGTYALSGSLTTTGAVFVRGALDPAGNTLTIGGNLSLLSAGVLVMQNPTDIVIVGGTARFTGGSTNGLLTNGVLRVSGGIVADASGTGSPATSFTATGAHVVQLAGAGPVTIDIINGGNSGFTSRFSNLDLSLLTGTANLARFTATYVTGQLISQPDGTPPTLGTTAGGWLNVNGVDVNGLTVDNVTLTVFEGTLTQFDNVTFVNFPAASGPLSIHNPGNATPFTMNNIVFTTTPSGTGARYLLANDTDGPTPNPLVINMVNPTPATPDGFIAVSNGAVINWPVGAAGARTWSGAQSSAWANPANWVGGVVPTAADSVHVPSGTPFAPQVTVPDTIRALSVAANATFSLNAAFWVRETVDVAPTGSMIGGGGALHLVSETTGTISGSLPSIEVDAGLFTLDGDAVINGDLIIYGQEFTPGVPVLGDVSVGNFNLTITNGLFTGQLGRFTMMGTGLVDIGGYANFFGASTAGRLTSGTMRIFGEFYQDGGESTSSFQAGGTHLVQFTGTDRIVFATPNDSRFQDMAFTTPGIARTLWTDFHAAGVVSVPAANVLLASDAGVGAGNSMRIHAGRVETFGVNITFRNVAFTTGAFTSNFGGTVTFTDFDPDIVQLDIQGSTNALNSTLNSTSFLTTPTSAGRWVRIVDTNGATGGSPTLTVVNPTPVHHGGWAEAIAPATMTGWAAAPEFRWTGAVDANWGNPANWADGIVPSATDSVHIQDGFTTAPQFPGQVTMRAFVADVTSDFLNIDGEVTVTGRLWFPQVHSISCDGGEVILNGANVAVSGYIPCGSVLVEAGTTVADGRVRVAGDLLVWGADALLVLGRNTVEAPFFQTIEQGRVRMTEPLDSLIVGAATFRGGSTAGLLTDGTMVVTGNFDQSNETSGESFQASGNHNTVFAGDINQQMSMATPGLDAGQSRFAHVTMAKVEGGTYLQLNAALIATGQLRTGQGAPQQQLRKIFSDADPASVLVRSAGANVANLVFNNAKWLIQDGAAIEAMDQVTFQAVDSAATQLDMQRSGGETVTMRQATFATTVMEGLYLRLVDVDGATGGAFTLIMDVVTPATHAFLVSQLNGAQLQGWDSGGILREGVIASPPTSPPAPR